MEHITDEELGPFLDRSDDIPSERFADLERHLEQCEECRERFDDFKAFRERSRKLVQEVETRDTSRPTYQDVMAKRGSSSPPRPRPKPQVRASVSRANRTTSRPVLLPLLLAGSAIGIIAVAAIMLRPAPPNDQSASTSLQMEPEPIPGSETAEAGAGGVPAAEPLPEAPALTVSAPSAPESCADPREAWAAAINADADSLGIPLFVDCLPIVRVGAQGQVQDFTVVIDQRLPDGDVVRLRMARQRLSPIDSGMPPLRGSLPLDSRSSRVGRFSVELVGRAPVALLDSLLGQVVSPQP